MRAFRYRIYPTKEQADAIRRTAGCVRYVYNGLLGDYKDQYKQWKDNGKQGLPPELREVTFLKASAPFLDDVDSLALANSKINLKTAFKNFFDWRKGKRKGKKVGFPTFHKKGKSKNIYKTNNQNDSIRFEGTRIKLPKIGFVEVNLHRPCVGKIRSVCVEAAKNGTFYISVLTDIEPKEYVNNTPLDELKIVGIDMSFSDFCVDSDDTAFDDAKPKYVRWYRSEQKKRRRLNRTMSRREEGSRNREKARRKLAAKDAHISNRRKDFCHKMSHHYASEYDAIVLEDINMQELARTCRKGWGKSVCDLGFGMFKQYLSYKCKDRDVLLVYADKWFPSSKTCNHCGAKNTGLELNDREWVCPECGAVIQRDYNAACNLKDYFVRIINTAGTAGIHACGDVTSTLRLRAERVTSVKQEAPSFRWG